MIGRALDVLNAPGSTREEFQALFKLRYLGHGDMEELSPQLWEELRLDSSGAEYDLLGRDQAEDEAQGTAQVLDRPSYLRPLVLPLSGGIHPLRRSPEPP